MNEIDTELAAIASYQQKHSTCDIQQHPWQAVFGAGFEAAASQRPEQAGGGAPHDPEQDEATAMLAAYDRWKDSREGKDAKARITIWDAGWSAGRIHASSRLAIAERLLTVERHAASEREQRMRAALLGVATYRVSPQEACWCPDEGWSGTGHTPECLDARAALSEMGPAGPARGAEHGD